MALFAILRAFPAGFEVVVWVCIVWVLCAALRGFCVRERLGGLEACGVFALVFILLPCSSENLPR